jgi:uncharacterized membrane protein YqaE (UPF0057 family)
MLYLVAVILPPLAVLLCGKPFQAILNLVLVVVTVYIGALIHAIFVVHNHYSDQRQERLLREMRKLERERKQED